MRVIAAALFGLMLACQPASPARLSAGPAQDLPLFNDSHVHLTNYVQKGVDIRDFLGVMGGRVGRAALFGIPLQQLWSHRVSGDDAPTYYLHADSPLYYYSFTDAHIATAYLSLAPAERKRFDPMITGFNPADMYAVDHIRRVLATFPGVFRGIGEFSVHKEFVSAKVAGDVPSLRDPALDRILDFAAESGLLVLLHCDIDAPFAKPGAKPAYLDRTRDLLLRHPDATVVWAHVGLGRVVHPLQHHVAVIESLLTDPRLSRLHFDISWDELAKYITSSPEAVERTAGLLNRYPDRFLFGTDEVAPADPDAYLQVYRRYAPLWGKLTPDASEKIRLLNHARLFDAADRKVRAWERANLPPPRR